MKALFRTSAYLAVVSALALAAHTALGAVIYDNSTVDLNSRFEVDGNEIGDEVVLSTANVSVITNFQFEYYAIGGAFAGSETVRLRFYANDGVLSTNGYATPGTVVYDSGAISLNGYASDRATIVFDAASGDFGGVGVAVPPDFTWSVEFGGLTGGETAGVDLYGPPSVGSSYSDAWLNTGTHGVGNTTAWVLIVSTNSTDLDFGAVFAGTNAVAPSITTAPLSVTTNVNTSVNFTVAALGTGPLSYQWYLNGSAVANLAGNVAGAATAHLALTHVGRTNTGSYTVVVNNLAGSITSAPAILALNGAPGFPVGAHSLTNNQGTSLTLSYGTTTGTAPISYQWTHNGTNLPGKTTTSLLYAIADITNAGSYTLIAWNIAGTNTSAVIDVTIYTRPVISLLVPAVGNNSNNVGSNITYAVTASSTAPGLAYQWRRNGTNILGATGTSYSFTVSSTFNQPGSAGSYAVGITNTSPLAVNIGTISGNIVLVTNVQPGFGTVHFLNKTNIAGTVPLSPTWAQAVTTGTKPVAYQWYFNGTAIPGATTTAFTVTTNLPGAYSSYTGYVASLSGSYSLVASNMAGIAANGAYMQINADTNKPLITVLKPSLNQIITNGVQSNAFTAYGLASDGAQQVTNVLAWLNGNPITVFTTNRWKGDWTIDMTNQLAAGSNTLVMQSVDFSGNLSKPATNKFFFSVTNVLTIITNGAGSGTVSNLNLVYGAKVSITNGVMLEVGRTYTVTANPAPGSVFTNYLINSTYVGGLPAYPKANYNFVFTTNMTITATFVPTPFTNHDGIYDGLFYETNGVSYTSSGFVRVTATTNGTYTLNVLTAGDNLTVASVAFDASGAAHVTIPRTAQKHSTLSLDLQLDLTGGSDTVTGNVASVTGDLWTAPFTSSRSIYHKSGTPSPMAGNYVMVITNTGDASGYGFGKVNITYDGLVGITGNLGDGTPMVQGEAGGVLMSKDNVWPMYLSIYPKVTYNSTSNYSKGGSVLGYIQFTNNGTVTNITGTVVWTKLPVATNVFYPQGFTNTLEVAGTGLVTTHLILDTTHTNNLTLTLDGADLATPINITGISIDKNNNVHGYLTNDVSQGSPSNLKITATSGFLTGNFVNPTTHLTNTFSSAVLQNLNQTFGEFISTNSAGSVNLHP